MAVGSTSIREYDIFVNGKWTSSTSDESIAVEYPFDGEVWARVPEGTQSDVDAAVQVAETTFRDEWQSTLASERREILRQIADVMDEHAEELGRLETRQNGKLIREMVLQVGHAAEYFRYFARMAEEAATGRTNPIDNKGGRMLNYVRREPYGVVGAVTPWNSPILLTTTKLAPALAAGNTFVHKPSEITPVSALRFAELITEETDLPAGAYNVVTGEGPTGAALVDHSDVDKVAFTGSTAVGREIAAKAGRNLTPATMELGGKSPNVIFSSADLDNAVNGIMKGVFAATGQTCMAGSRVIVEKSIHDAVVDRLVEAADRIEMGDPLEEDTQMGPLAFRDQWEKVEHYVDLALEEGAELACGGGRPDEYPDSLFFDPTVLTAVESEMTAAQEEIFGPVASVISFETVGEALELANDVDYGLAGAVWTEDMQLAHEMVEGIEAGNVWVNDYRVVNPRSPFGGYNDSGLGVEGGPEGLAEYYRSKSVYYNQSGEVGDPFSLDT